MPYAISLDRDAERGLDRYTIALGEDFDARDAHEVSDWLSAAAQNPTATFRIDVSAGPSVSSPPVATLLARCAWLRARRRVEVVRRQLSARTAALASLGVLTPLF